MIAPAAAKGAAGGSLPASLPVGSLKGQDADCLLLEAKDRKRAVCRGLTSFSCPSSASGSDLFPRNVRLQVETITSLDLLTELAERVLSAHSLEEMGLA
jgi:hypothetical protein